MAQKGYPSAPAGRTDSSKGRHRANRYADSRFKEHNKVRVPLLRELLRIGYDRGQIICPSDDSDDVEWRVPKNPSEAAKREAGKKFDGFPCDIAVFDSVADCGDYRHLRFIVECKQPDIHTGKSQLETYLSLEPRARTGIWTNGQDMAVIEILADGSVRESHDRGLPAPGENLVHSSKPVTYNDLQVPDSASLMLAFNRLLNAVVSSDGRSTRSDSRLNQMCNLLLVKLESDRRARLAPTSPCLFQIEEDPQVTVQKINGEFKHIKDTRKELFSDDEADTVLFDVGTIQEAVALIQGFDLHSASPETLSVAFQVFRNAHLKIGEGQYYTPSRVIKSAVDLLGITPYDKVIDPACGAGGFICEALLRVQGQVDEAEAVRWANSSLYGIDKDDINVKLTRALMVGMGDGSTHIQLGDSLREAKWPDYGHAIEDTLADGSYSVVVTNPPFGEGLKLSATDARKGRYTVCKHKSNGTAGDMASPTELGIVFVERSWRLLRPGGRLGIILPETYFFSASYEWFRQWLDAHFELRAVMNVPMEAFQGFCRAKTNFYVLEKRADDALSRARENMPRWLPEGSVWVCYAPTIGINKNGAELFKIDSSSNTRTSEIDDAVSCDVRALISGGAGRHARLVGATPIGESFIGVPQYLDDSTARAAREWIASKEGCCARTLGELVDDGILQVRPGHKSPPDDLRGGDVPYVKVSDLRAGLVNINRSNSVPRSLAQQRAYWGSDKSGLSAWDVLTPSRASKNIGEPVMLLPGQEDILVTKEVLVFRAGRSSHIDGFAIMWMLSAPKVLAQWERVVFMQTNRQDIGSRWREIVVPLPADERAAAELSKPFREYYVTLSSIRERLATATATW